MHVFSVASSIWPLKTVLLLVEVALLRKQIFFFYYVHKNPCIRLKTDSSVF